MRLSDMPRTSAEISEALKHSKEAVKQLEQALDAARKVEAEQRRKEPLTNKMRIAGWTGPTGWRLQTYEARSVECHCCGAAIPAGTQHVAWSTLPIGMECSSEAAEAYRRRAHADCLRKLAIAHIALHMQPIPRSLRKLGETTNEYIARARGEGKLHYQTSRDMAAARLGMKWPAGLYFMGAKTVPAEVLDNKLWSTI